MRFGYTTGSCSAAAAGAATYMLLSGRKKEEIKIITPKGIEYTAKIEDTTIERDYVSCAVRKDGGDDIDATHGMLIYAKVSFAEDEDFLPQNPSKNNIQDGVIVDGGIGIGRVTREGLDQPIGNAAINHVPRKMIIDEVNEVKELFDEIRPIKVIIYAPEGEKIAEKTFNERLGIVGGISILGTSGIVEPMSIEAILATIRIELKQRFLAGYDYVVISPGNYGQDYIKKVYKYDIDKSVKCSNYIGKTIDMAKEIGFKKIFLIGHIGKLIKISGGIMNTHSREADCRMELICTSAIKAGIRIDGALKILDCVSTEAAIDVLKDYNILNETFKIVMDRIIFYLNKRAGDGLSIDCLTFANNAYELAKSEGADKWFTLLEQEAEPQTLSQSEE